MIFLASCLSVFVVVVVACLSVFVCLFQEYVVPEEYVQTMRESMLKRCPVSSYEEVRGVFAKDLGESPETVSALLTSFLHYCLCVLSNTTACRKAAE